MSKLVCIALLMGAARTGLFCWSVWTSPYCWWLIGAFALLNYLHSKALTIDLLQKLGLE